MSTNWSDYPVFLAVAEAGSLTAAGKSLGMSQPTVGRRIRALEDHFGTPLLRREDGNLIPTTFGQSMLDHIRRMQDEAAAIDRSSATLEDSLSGVVRLSATEGIGTAWLPGVMQHFRATHPDVLIDIGIGFRDFNLAQREADIALRWKSPGEQNSLIGRKVATCKFGLFASPEYLARAGVPETLSDLSKHDGVVASIMDGKILWITDHDTEQPMHLPGRITFKSNSIWAFCEGLEQGYGIGMLPLNATGTTAAHLTRVMDHFEHEEDLYLVAHQDLKRSARIRAVFDFLVEAFRQDQNFFRDGGDSVFASGGIVMKTPSSSRVTPSSSHLTVAAE
jgi:DNA-binding transcriptional LysR family regulator